MKILNELICVLKTLFMIIIILGSFMKGFLEKFNVSVFYFLNHKILLYHLLFIILLN